MEHTAALFYSWSIHYIVTRAPVTIGSVNTGLHYKCLLLGAGPIKCFWSWDVCSCLVY